MSKPKAGRWRACEYVREDGVKVMPIPWRARWRWQICGWSIPALERRFRRSESERRTLRQAYDTASAAMQAADKAWPVRRGR